MKRLLIGGSTALAALAVTLAYKSPAQTLGQCAPPPSRANALDNPSKHAWDLFLALNHPAKDEAVARGEPDCAKRFGAPGTTAVWETWRNAETEVFLPDGAEPPAWQDNSLPDEKPGQVPEETTMFPSKAVLSVANAKASPGGQRQLSVAAGILTGEVSVHGQRAPSDGGPSIKFSPSDGVFDDAGGFGETRMNKATYDFVRDNCLFSREGGQRYANAVVAGKKKPISFPVDSIEAKAAWLDFDKENIPASKRRTYYTAQYKGKSYGLVALHIITKDIPNWFWASFHHKDSPDNPFETGDSAGPPAAVKGTVWENYELGGTQIDFVTPTGAAVILSDHYVEFNFQRSSCITCHATATISPTSGMPGGQPKSLCAMNGSLPQLGLDAAACRKQIGADQYKAGTDNVLVERGVPDPNWFKVDGKPYYLQTDFVYAIPFRGFRRREAAPPPARCIW